MRGQRAITELSMMVVPPAVPRAVIPHTAPVPMPAAELDQADGAGDERGRGRAAGLTPAIEAATCRDTARRRDSCHRRPHRHHAPWVQSNSGHAFHAVDGSFYLSGATRASGHRA